MLKVAQQAILFTPEFHNMGDPQTNGDRPPKNSPSLPHTQRSYKATVMLFLAGGADTFQMLMPVGCPLYDEYTTVRGSIAHNPTSVITIQARTEQTSKCRQFGVHPKLQFLARTLYEKKKKAAFVSNIGNLVVPLNRSNFKTGSRCLGMFSHSHQQSAAHTLHCQMPGAAPLSTPNCNFWQEHFMKKRRKPLL